MKKKLGFTLIELVIFVVVMGIIASMISIFYGTLFRGSANINQQIDASQTATQCMEWYLGQRFISGFNSSSLSNGTSIPGFCTVPTGYNIATTVSSITLYADPINYKIITVTVTGQGNAKLSTIIANY